MASGTEQTAYKGSTLARGLGGESAVVNTM